MKLADKVVYDLNNKLSGIIETTYGIARIGDYEGERFPMVFSSGKNYTPIFPENSRSWSFWILDDMTIGDPNTYYLSLYVWADYGITYASDTPMNLISEVTDALGDIEDISVETENVFVDFPAIEKRYTWATCTAFKLSFVTYFDNC